MMPDNDLIERLIAGETRSVARAISRVERGGDAAALLMKDIFPNIFLPSLRHICRIACDLEDSEMVEFCDVILIVLPY